MSSSTSTSSRALSWLILAALLALAFNLRSPLTAIPPVITDIRQSLHISTAAAGLLTSIPVLCFGLLTPLASWLIGKIGIEKAIFLTLISAGLGLVFRPFSGGIGLFGFTLMIGAALAIGNIVCLMVIAQNFSRRMNSVTGLYTAALNVGTMLTGALTAPLAIRVGWQTALASWVWLIILALVLWMLVAWQRPTTPVMTKHTELDSTISFSSLFRRPIVWVLALVFALHLFIYYSITAWLPSYLMTRENMSSTQAGLVASCFQILSLLGSFSAPALSKYLQLGWQLVIMSILWLLTPLLMLAIPQHWPIWAMTGGIAQGGIFVIVFMLIMQKSNNLTENRRMSTIIQGIGYSLASLGPILMGSMHEHWQTWNTGFELLAGLSGIMLLAGFYLLEKKE